MSGAPQKQRGMENASVRGVDWLTLAPRVIREPWTPVIERETVAMPVFDWNTSCNGNNSRGVVATEPAATPQPSLRRERRGLEGLQTGSRSLVLNLLDADRMEDRSDTEKE